MAITKARVKSDADAGAVLTVYANLAAFPTTGPSVGDQAFNQDNNKIYVWNGNGWFYQSLTMGIMYWLCIC